MPRDLPVRHDLHGRARTVCRLAGVRLRHRAGPSGRAGDDIARSSRRFGRLAKSCARRRIKLVSDLRAAFGAEIPAGPWGQCPEPGGVGADPADRRDRPRRRRWSSASTRSGCSTTTIAASSALSPGRSRRRIANAQAYEEERRRAEALAEIDRAKTTFFSNVSHEFRTPLTLMLGPIEDALNDASTALPRIQRGRLETAHRNSLRLLKLVNSLLDFSRIEAGRVEASFEPIDLAKLTAELASNFESATERAGLALRIDCRRSRAAGLCRPRDVGKDRPQPHFQRVQVHF